MRNAYKIVTGRKRPLERPRHKWEDIRMALQEIALTDSICSGQGEPTKAWYSNFGFHKTLKGTS
jgi:hypothetical protein